MPVYDTFRDWALASHANRVYAVIMQPVRKVHYGVSRQLYLCTEPQMGLGDTVFDDNHEFVSCITGIPDIYHSAQVIFSGDSLVSFGDIEVVINPEVAIDPATGWDVWAAEATYALGEIVRPATPNGCYYECITPGDSGEAEPDWPFAVGDTVIDGACTWQCKQLTWDVLLDEWVFAGHPVEVLLGGPELDWENWATVLSGYMGEPTYTDSACSIPIYSPAVKALQAEIPPRTYDPDNWPHIWEAGASHVIGDIITGTTRGYAKIPVDADEVISSGYHVWDKWKPENAFDGDTKVYQFHKGGGELQWNRWMSPERAGGPSGVDYIGIKKSAAVQVDRVRIHQMAEAYMVKAHLQYRDTDGESWTTLAALKFTVRGNAWETKNVSGSSEHKQWRLLAAAQGSGTHWSTAGGKMWGIYELEFSYAGATRGYLYVCTGTGSPAISGDTEPTWPTTPGELVTEYYEGDPSVNWRCMVLPEDLRDTPVPLCYGQVKNLTPVCLNNDADSGSENVQVYQFHDPEYGAIAGVDAVYINGVQQTEVTHYHVFPERGIIRFRSTVTVDGPVTMDVRGAELTGVYSDLVGDIIKQWLSDFAGMVVPGESNNRVPFIYSNTDYELGFAGWPYGGLTTYWDSRRLPVFLRAANAGITGTFGRGKIWPCGVGEYEVTGEVKLVTQHYMGSVDEDALTKLNEDLPFPVGVYLTDRVTVKQALDDLLAGLMCWWGVTRQGGFTAARFQAPAASSALIPWNPHTIYQAGQIIRPRINGFYYLCTVTGVSGYWQPAWPEEDEAEVSDGTAQAVTWQAQALEDEEGLIYREEDILAFEVEPEERLVNKCTVYGERNWTPSQSVDEDNVSRTRRQWLHSQWREREANADENVIRVYPLATSMSHQTFLVELEDCADLAEGYIELFGIKREAVRLTLPAHGVLAAIGDQVLIIWRRYGYAQGLYARVVAIRESHGATPRVVIEAWR
jgi:hypothetical protein